MPHRAYRQDKAQVRVDAPQIGVGFGQAIDDFIRREQLAHEKVGGLLVAVTYQFPGFAQAVGPGRAQRQQHHISLPQKGRGAPDQLLNGLKQLHRRVGPNAAVQVVALPAAACLHEVLLPVNFFAGGGAKQAGQRQRLKHGAKRIDQRCYFVGRQAGADAVGKTGAHGEDPRRAR